MKKVVRTVWIGLLSGLAFLVACTSPKGLTRAEKKQLKEERAALISQIDQQRQESLNTDDPSQVLLYRNSEYDLRQRLSVINSKLGDRSAQMDNCQEMGIILDELDSLKAAADANTPKPVLYGPPTSNPVNKKERKKELQSQLDQLLQAIQRRENSCVYGSPEVIERYGQETRRMRQEAADLQQQIEDLDNESGKK